MRGKGITYDTGFIRAGTSTREAFDPRVVERELHVIRQDLHCNAARLTGGDPDRLELAATAAAEAGHAGCRSAEIASRFRDDLRALVARGRVLGKPVAVTEFGCTTHRGAADLPHRGDPREDLDLASYGVVKVLEGRLGHTYPGMPWEPKTAFAALADAYRG